MQFSLPCFSVRTIALASLLVGAGCAQAEELGPRGGSSGRAGSGGEDGGSGGAAGSGGTETGGSGGTGATGSGGAAATGGVGGGRGGSGGSSGAADAGGGKGGSGGSTGGTGGKGGSGGATAGAGGATGGSGGATGGTGGVTGGSGGVGGTGAGGSDAGGGVEGGLGSCPAGVSYCNDFERDTAGIMPVGWTRVGGSDGDWQVFFDTSNVFAQNHASSSTFRLCYPNGAPGGPWSGATTVSARVKILAAGSSGTTMAFLCLGYAPGSNYGCLALDPSGARIRMNAGSSSTDGPLWPTAIATGTWYDVKISMDATGALSAYLNGTMLGSYMPPSAIAGGYVAVATQSSQAAFDTVTVTQP